jgi:HKD family nuclease
MLVPQLELDFQKELHNSKAIYVAVALMKQYGLNLIEKAAPAECKRKYILGVTLPTSPNVLADLLKKKEKFPVRYGTRIFDGKSNFHPKVYIVVKPDDSICCFVGSANATQGGFNNNVEMNIKIVDQSLCKEILKWFEEIYSHGKEYDVDFINEYKVVFIKNNQLQNTQASNLEIY